MPQLTAQISAVRPQGPPSTAANSAPGFLLRPPKCLLEYERAAPPPTGKGGAGAHFTAPEMSDGGGRPLRQPSPLDKLSTYRRLCSQTKQGPSDGGAAPAHSGGQFFEGRGAALSEVEGSARSVYTTQLPREITKYILDLEGQNHQLRQQVIELQEELQQQQKPQGTLDLYRKLADTVVGNGQTVTRNGHASLGYPDATDGSPIASGLELSHEERGRYINDVFAQVDMIVQAHRNQSEATILRHKQEAEAARLALNQLREAIALEGVDLSMLPVVLSVLTGRSPATGGSVGGDSPKVTSTTLVPTGFDAAVASIATLMNKKCSTLVDEAAGAVLRDLLNVEASDDVPAVVRQSVQRGFETLSSHLATVVTDHIGHCIGEVRHVHKEREVACRELREELRVSESQRLRMAQKYETEICALRDGLHAFYNAAANGDELKGVIHERAFEEYSAMLVKSRMEAESLRNQLEGERSDHAAACLRLKMSLQRRNSEFEEAIERRAEEFVGQRDSRIAELQQQIDAMRQAEVRRTDGRAAKGVQTQAAESVVLNESNYMANVLSFSSSLKGTSPAPNQHFATPTHPTASHSAIPSLPPPLVAQPPVTPLAQGRADAALQPENSFEEEVWAKTLELLTKYGNISQH